MFVRGFAVQMASASTIRCVQSERIRVLSSVRKLTPSKGGVVYWMSRDQRVQDNWALLHARDLALEHKVPLSVVFCLVPHFHEATIRHYGFMLRGMEEIQSQLQELSLPFALLSGWPAEQLPQYVQKHEICAVVTDFSPLRVPRAWKNDLVSSLPSIPIIEVDAHNVVPVWVASPKLEVGARTIRPKITNLLPVYLKDIPKLELDPRLTPAASIVSDVATRIDWEAVRASLQVFEERAARRVCRPRDALLTNSRLTCC